MANEKNRTLWVGNLAKEVTEELLYELFLQAGPLERVKIPKGHSGFYGFITYEHEDSVPYAVQLFEGVSLFNRQLNIKPKGGQIAQPQQHDQYPKRNHSNSRENESPYKHIRFNNDDNLMPPPQSPKFHSQPQLPQHSFEDLLRLGEQMNIYHNVNNGNYDHGASTSIDLNDYDHRDRPYERHDNRRPRHDQDRQRDNRRNFRRDQGGRDYHNNRSNGNRYRRH